MRVDCAIVGGGIIGLSVAMTLLQKQPGLRLVVLEKEKELAFHQTGRNSGVIHSGIYYRPGSLKARFAVNGNRSMTRFCQEQGIAHEVCGKIIVATERVELPRLEALFARGTENGIPVSRLSKEEVSEIEPHVVCLGAVRVPTTGIVNYFQVSQSYAEIVRRGGGVIKTNARADTIRRDDGFILETSAGPVEARFLINCAGLQSDRVARRAGSDPQAMIVPFRGEYYELVPERRGLVKGLVYPVPDPNFPFLGVHFTRMIDGSVHAGPNAVLALRREGYRKSDFELRTLRDIAGYGGFWKLAGKHWRAGLAEMMRSLSKPAFVRSLQRLIPEIEGDDLQPSTPGVRAQALRNDGTLVDDFLIVQDRNAVHVCNAPSPAATASLEIGRAVADLVPELKTTVVAV